MSVLQHFKQARVTPRVTCTASTTSSAPAKSRIGPRRQPRSVADRNFAVGVRHFHGHLHGIFAHRCDHFCIIAGAAMDIKAQHQDHALAGPFHLRAHHRMNLCAISRLECGIFTVIHGRRAGPDRRHRLTFCRTCSVCSCCTGLPTDGARILP